MARPTRPRFELEPCVDTEQPDSAEPPLGWVALSLITSVSPDEASPLGFVPGPVERGAGPVPSAFGPGLSVGLPGTVVMPGCHAAGTSESQMESFRPFASASAPL